MPVPIPASLVRHLKDGRCALFAGAGLSAGAGLPGWKQLLSILVEDVESEDPAAATSAELRKLLDAGRLLDVADHCRQRLGERRYYELLGQQLRGGSGDIPESHGLITRLPFGAIITTNYDKLLERAYTRMRGDLPKVVTARDRESLGALLFSGGFFILKAHGDIDDAESLVLTARDYREIIHANPAFNALFSALLMTKSILFVGYSLGDPDFRLLLDRQLSAFGENIPERYAVMAGVGSVESDVLKRAANIKVLSYPEGEHHEVTSFLRTLVERTGGAEAESVTGGASPGARAVAVPRAPSVPRLAPAGGAPRASEPAPPDVLAARPGAYNIDDREAELVTAKRSDPIDDREARLVIASRGDRIEATLRAGTEPVSQLSGPMSWSGFYARLAALLDPKTGSSSASDDYRRAGALLADLLPRQALAALPDDTILAIEAPPELANVPWELVPGADDRPLAVTRPIVRVMAADTAAARGLPGLRRPLRLLVIGDPGSDPALRLPGAYAEAVEIARRYTGAFEDAQATLLCREEATLDAIVGALTRGSWDIVHFAGHAWFDAQESFLAFDGGEQITASELRSLLGRRPPAVLFLNSHYTAFLPRGMRPKELADRDEVSMPPTSHIGFTDMATTTGTGAFIGCFASPTDAAAKQMAVAVHRELIGGSALAHAVRTARQETVAAHPGDVSPLQYVLAGYPHYRLP